LALFDVPATHGGPAALAPGPVRAQEAHPSLGRRLDDEIRLGPLRAVATIARPFEAQGVAAVGRKRSNPADGGAPASLAALELATFLNLRHRAPTMVLSVVEHAPINMNDVYLIQGAISGPTVAAERRRQ